LATRADQEDEDFGKRTGSIVPGNPASMDERSLVQYAESRVPPEIMTTISVTGGQLLPDEICEELYVVLREAIRNAALHAKANKLEVSVTIAGGEAQAMVRDDGKGFDVAERLAAATGIGLSSMRERLELLGGTLAIDSQPGHGTVISMFIPLPESET
jgi:signal transduction histidine kinase